MTFSWNEELVEQTVTYSLEMNGQLFLVENVPARVNMETGERFFLHRLLKVCSGLFSAKINQLVLLKRRFMTLLHNLAYELRFLEFEPLLDRSLLDIRQEFDLLQFIG